MRLQDHPAVKLSWSVLSWAHGGTSQIQPLDSMLQDVHLEKLPRDNHVRLTRSQDGATAALFSEDEALLPNLCATLSKCVRQTVRDIGLREVNDDLTLI